MTIFHYSRVHDQLINPRQLTMHTNKSIRIAAVLIALCTVGWLTIIPGIVGMRAEDEMKKIELDTSNTSSLPIKGQLISFQRGWFSSDAKTDYVIMLGSFPMHLMVEHHINQIAIPFYRWANITHTVNLVSDDGKASNLPFDVNANSDRLFFGGYSSLISAKSVNWKNADGVEIMGNNLSLKVVGKLGEAISYDLTVPMLTIMTAEDLFKVNVTNLTMNGNNIGDQNPNALWVQHSHLALENIEASQNGIDIFSVHHADVNADLKDHGKTIDLLYHTNVSSTSFGNTDSKTAGANGFIAEDIKLDFSYLNLSKEALTNLQNAAKELNQTALKNVSLDTHERILTDQQTQQQLEQFNQLIDKSGDLIRSSPSIKLDQFSMKTAEGAITGKAELDLDGKDFQAQKINLSNLVELLKPRLSGKASFNIARNVFIHGFENKNTDLAQQRQLKENMLKTWVEQGYVKDDGNNLILESTFTPQGLEMNGKHVM